ncbi:MAG TPA: outer membrane beta-barrel protein [Xanthobacteraceae bacterium]|jgi:outer membrane immunogenic protein
MKKFLLGTAALVALGVPAIAADMPVRRAPPAPVFSWTGCYIGPKIGYDTGKSKVFSPPGALTAGAVPGTVVLAPSGDITPQFNVNGLSGGGEVGCQVQWGVWVLGIEGDGEAASLSGQSFDLPPAFNPSFVNQTNVRWTSTLRGRLGYAWDKWLLYVTGGAAWAGVEETGWQACPAPGVCPGAGVITASGVPSAHDRKTMFGYAVGAGTAYALGYGWSIKSEYIFMQFKDKDFFNPPQVSTTGTPFLVVNPNRVSLYEHTFKWGLNYKFDFLGGKAPYAYAAATK